MYQGSEPSECQSEEPNSYKGCAMSDTPTRQQTEADAPLQDFSRCHVGFVTVLETALGLP